MRGFFVGVNLRRMAQASRIQEIHASTAISFVEHARVRLRETIAKHRLKAGATGTIVHVYEGGSGFEVEFGAGSASPQVITLDRDVIEPLTD